MSTVYEIGPFRLDAQAAVLTHAGVPMALGARGVAVLRTLVERPHEYVAKGSIIDAAWAGVVVEESNLAVQIAAIRRVLGRVLGGERWIETLSRRGYRFVGPVTAIRDDKEKGSRIRHSNLPALLTSFVGRERELVEIKRLLPGNRLLSLVGAGGIGKTRLALQVAAEVADAYRDGVWLVEFGSIRDPLLVPTSAAQVLGVQERAGASLTDTLCTYLKGRQVLVILDNCEHLLDACARLADAVLRGAVDTTIIVTSREPLEVVGEQTYPLQPLSLPDLSGSAETMRGSEAVQLFVERVRRQLPEFEPTPARAPVIAELCIHLDGIPLALELAAARTRSLSIEQINTRLQDRFKLLTSGNRTALPRQQTLRATLDWSYDLLAEDERVVLRQLAVFPGSFTLESASAVASNGAIDEFAVIDLMSQLVARSLVVADTTEAGARYRLLETTRAYALEKLVEAEEIDRVRHRHAQHFRNLFERAPDDWQRLPDSEWCTRYQPELDNVRAALDWAFGGGGDPAIGIELSAAAGELWYVLFLRNEGQQRLEAAVGRVGSHTSKSDEARLWRWLGQMWVLKEPAQALAAFERAIGLHREAGDGSVPGILLLWLGEELAHQGRVERAVSVLAEAFPALERAGLPKTLAQYFLVSGAVKTTTGNLAAARIDYEKGVALARSAGAERLTIGGLNFLADLAWEMGDLDVALAGFREAAALMRRIATTRKGTLGLCLTNLAGIHAERGELDEALAAAREGLPMRKAAGHAWSAFDHLALRVALAGKTGSGARLAGYADAAYTAKATPRQANEARARERLRALLCARLAHDELEQLLAEGATMSEEEACRLALED